ncbi:three component ABC system middle component [Quadrisphaera granulorum]|uniref:three component ABC system middle component n=1 Tax=Quadrisphaera granulorum TaxID=317664 RepID=UPI003CCC5496
MIHWNDQPAAVRATLNPLLIAAVVAWSSRAYAKAGGHEGMPWPLAFVAPALILHPPSRQALPGSTKKRLIAWRDENDSLVEGLPERCRNLRPFTQAGLRAGLRHGFISVQGPDVVGRLSPGRTPDELREVARASALLGRWLAPLPASTVLGTLGMTT